MKILIVHPAQQHSYELATALKKSGYLSKYMTTVYYKANNLTWIVSKILKGESKRRAKTRSCTALEDKDIIQFCELLGLIKLLCSKVGFLKKYYKSLKYFTADRFAKKVARYVLRHDVDAVVTYDDCSPILFETLKEQAPKVRRIMDMSAANLLYMREIYDTDVILAPTFAERLKKEREIVWDPFIIDRTNREIKNTQDFLVPSNFVKKSLAFSGVNENQMHMCPYGVDLNDFKQKKYDDYIDRPIKFIYVGGVKELKGIYYLLEAFNKIPADKAILTVIGSANIEDEDLQLYKNKTIFTGLVMHDRIPALLREADVFVFPSLGEGLSLATLEAAACGLPLIVSENSGVNDAIVNGREGYIIPIQSSDAIEEAVMRFVDNPNDIKRMGKNARNMALQYTWDNYYRNVEKILGHLSN